MPDQNEYFDFYKQTEKSKEMTDKLVANHWDLDEGRWLETQSEDFYKGMYAMIRVAQSILDQKSIGEIEDMYSRIGLDLMFIIHKKSLEEKSKIL